jgi:hypothetical protein
MQCSNGYYALDVGYYETVLVGYLNPVCPFLLPLLVTPGPVLQPDWLTVTMDTETLAVIIGHIQASRYVSGEPLM